jgi:hypothetical protein
MIDPDLLALGYLVVKALTTGRAEQTSRKVLAKLDSIERRQNAIATHIGVEFDGDRVIELHAGSAYADDKVKA